MKIILASFIFVLTSLSQIYSQFSIEKFIDEPFNHNISSVQDSIKKKVIEKEVMNYKGILYYDWMEPISIKVGYLFEKNGKQNGKVIGNGKDKPEEAKILFDKLKEILIKKYGSNVSENSMLGLTMLMWKEIDGISIMLTSKEEKTMLTIIKN